MNCSSDLGSLEVDEEADPEAVGLLATVDGDLVPR